MIRLARVWYNFVADYHNERALDHARRRDRALRKLERMERARLRRQVRRDIDRILAQSPKPEARILREAFRQHYRDLESPSQSTTYTLRHRCSPPPRVRLAADDTH
jgi:hypothetical protein